MTTTALKKALKDGALSAHKALYADTAGQTRRMIDAVAAFERQYGEGREASIFSVPGRCETIGNHTDHNRGCVIAAAINRDIIAVASPNEDGVIRMLSEGYAPETVDLSLSDDPTAFEKYSSAALVAGVAVGFVKNGHAIGGFDVYCTSEVLKGSGISSSAAFAVMIGNIMNHLYNDGAVAAIELAQISRYSENEFFCKPCGLMDQTACAVGGFVFIDLEDPDNPRIESIGAEALAKKGYELCLVNTGTSHADLNEDYASVPKEMKAVAALLGREALRGTAESDLLFRAPEIRKTLGDRALLRAIHFVRENERVLLAKAALKEGNVDAFFSEILASGHSSFEYLQNVYTVKAVQDQGLSLALAWTDGFMKTHAGAFRVHGGGFAGTILAFVKAEDADSYVKTMDGVFGEGATMRLCVRPHGAIRLLG